MAMGNNGLRVLGFCTKTLPIKQYGKAYPWSDGRDLGKSRRELPARRGQSHRKLQERHGRRQGQAPRPAPPQVGEGLVSLGLMALVDPPREPSRAPVAKCKTAGIKVIMVTGSMCCVEIIRHRCDSCRFGPRGVPRPRPLARRVEFTQATTPPRPRLQGRHEVPRRHRGDERPWGGQYLGAAALGGASNAFDVSRERPELSRKPELCRDADATTPGEK